MPLLCLSGLAYVAIGARFVPGVARWAAVLVLAGVMGSVAVAVDRQASTTCTADGPGLWYRVGRHQHEYGQQRGGLIHRAGAGDEVPRALLKRAVLQAHPITDQEVMAPTW